jgi:glycerophosphoryl diester phosphodiesterase
MRSHEPGLAPVIDGRRRVVCCHRANLSGSFPPNSLAAIDECIRARAPRIEIDVRFLGDGALLVFHDERFELETTLDGAVHETASDAVRLARFKDDETVSVPFLEEVVDLLLSADTVLQVDLKPMQRLTAPQHAALSEALAPLGQRALLGSQAWWNVRRFHPRQFNLALDPSLQWHYRSPRSEEIAEVTEAERRLRGYLPVRRGRLGLLDDSALALHDWAGDTYFEERVADIAGLVPGSSEWMVDYGTIRYMLAQGFALGDALAERGIELAAWTVHDEGPEKTPALLRTLFDAGVTTVITGEPRAIAAHADSLNA